MRRKMWALIAVATVATAGSVGAASAQGLTSSTSTKSRAQLFTSQAKFLDGRLANQYEGSVRLKPKSKLTDSMLPRYAGKYRGEFLQVAKAAARKHGIPEDLFLRLVQRESGWNPQAVSNKGAQGLAQLMPGTAELMGVDAFDPHENLDGGARYLKRMYEKFGNWRLALAAYNAGPGAVEQYGDIPPYEETKNYVVAILGS